MIPNEHALMLYKFGEKRWIQKIMDGKLSFSCGGAFILQAKRTGNIIQGDLHEGVFARLLNTNPKILEMKAKLGADFEKISDGDYSFLRRRSAKLKPIFCAFAYTAGDALENNKIVNSGKQKLRFEFDQRMYKGFSDQIKSNVVTDPFRFTLLFIQPKPFVDSIKQALRFKNIPYQMRKVKYIDMKSDEFFIEPNDNYDELFHKATDYEYQHEVRICLTGEKFHNVCERYSLNTQKQNKEDSALCYSEIYVEYIADIHVVEDEWEGVNHMAELNLKQITDKLNDEFDSDVRKLVFWYDAGAEFVSDIDSIEFENAKVLKLERDNQFYIKYFLEREDTKTNYLIYAPFPKPVLRDNHLADTIRYSKEFFADRASLLAVDLGIDEKFKPVLQHYIKFFGAKDRTQKFYELEIENFNKSVIETALMSVICKTKIVSFEEIVRTVITEGDLEENRYLAEFEKYDLIKPFWKMCEETFGYTDVSQSLSKFIYTLFVTYTSKSIHSELPQAWKNYCSYKSGNIIAFLDSLMNSLIFKDSFDSLSDLVNSTLNGDTVFEKLNVSDLAELEIFRKADIFLLKWLIERLENEDTDAKLNGHTIPELCKMRRKMHFGALYYSHYYILENAYYLIMAARFEPKKSVEDIWKSYIAKDHMVDQKYRYFYYHFDQVTNNSPYENLRDLVENIYTNRYLDPLSVAWNRAFTECKGNTGLIKQQEFYSKFVKHAKERVVVIISDALRFEVGQTLLKRLMSDEKCTATMNAMQSVLPSYTRFGMSALLPHKALSMSEDYKVLVDGKVCDDLKSREQVLQSFVPNSRTVQFDDIKTMKIADLKEIFTGQEVVYVYHNQVDARGDKLNTENEVFTACEEAVEEIHTMIKRLTSANNTRFIITADHGFIYKRDKLAESDKIGGFDKTNAFVGRRYVIAGEGVSAEGIGMVELGDILSNEDERIISVPIGSDVFKVSGGGQNFVHGGSTLQEILIPVIEVKTNKYYTETKAVSITLVSLVHKITNLTTNLDFIQTDAVTDVNKETTYKVYFITDDKEKISNDNIYVADKKDEDASKRVFRLKFTFKNKKYDKNRKYYLVAYDEKNALEVIRHEVQMDLAFADDFGFNL